jgi:hypothetical protein
MLCLERLKEVRKMVGFGDVKSTIATAIAAAFGFIIALTWNDIIRGLFSWGGLTISAITSAKGAIAASVTGIVITLVCIFGILYVSKWAGIKK